MWAQALKGSRLAVWEDKADVAGTKSQQVSVCAAGGGELGRAGGHRGHFGFSQCVGGPLQLPDVLRHDGLTVEAARSRSSGAGPSCWFLAQLSRLGLCVWLKWDLT